ncbi:hypothetical protein I316_06447 [Kwoniella heveanensis BCC8398]|uniref:Uncharacterized protein n=1 Tax=Kwoniella heveanensis BCC8398 TaxID=1296120 RepID=A0A1B9GL94_9TREE|nr:hypothetical protein I316_06447 [Kwoniella heveanensis BCC8398]
MASMATSYTTYESPPSPPATEEEIGRIPSLAAEAFALLSEQEKKLGAAVGMEGDRGDVDQRGGVGEETVNIIIIQYGGSTSTSMEK